MASPDDTRLIRAGKAPKSLPQTVGPPIQRGSTVLLPNAESLYDDHAQVTYGRQGLAAQAALQDALGEMEGATCVTLHPSGQAATAGALLAVLKAGDEVLVADTAYKPTRRFCDRVMKRFGVHVRYYDPAATAEELVDSASDVTRLILLESPGSLTFEMIDIPRVAELARARGILTGADNTWGAGYLFKPLEHGVDLSFQALTKYVGGHSDIFMGSVATKDANLGRALTDAVDDLGWAVAADEAYQMLRGLRTLPTRLARHGASSLKIAAWLRDQPEVEALYHPALPGCPGHEIWARDYSGACGLFAFALKPAPERAVNAFLNRLQLFGLGFSWGGFESLAIAFDVQLKVRSFAKDYGGPMIRLHVGLEDPDDLIADLRQGLEAFAEA
jgi:cystathionine beta-lyase